MKALCKASLNLKHTCNLWLIGYSTNKENRQGCFFKDNLLNLLETSVGGNLYRSTILNVIEIKDMISMIDDMRVLKYSRTNVAWFMAYGVQLVTY